MSVKRKDNGTLVCYDEACRALAKARTTDEVTKIRDRATAMKACAKIAKNHQLEMDATEIRIRSERRLGEMIAEQRATVGLNPGTRTKGGGEGAGGAIEEPPAIPTLADAGIDKKLSSWAQKVSAIPAKEFEAKIDEWREASADESVPVSAKFLSVAHVSHNAGDNEWYTPSEYIEAAIAVMGGIDLDPASSAEANKIVKAKRFYSAEDDGLSKRWKGRVWMNPPYASDLIGKFAGKLCESVKSGAVTEAIVLVNNATETKWFQELFTSAGAVMFPAGRVKFWHNERDNAAPLQGQAVLSFGSEPDVFFDQFRPLGIVCNVVCR